MSQPIKVVWLFVVVCLLVVVLIVVVDIGVGVVVVVGPKNLTSEFGENEINNS